jgi:hypothetical protein
VAPATFVAASEILLFTGWAVIWKLIVAILIGFALPTLSTAADVVPLRVGPDCCSARRDADEHESSAGTLTPTPIVAATSREPSAFITTIDQLPERSFHVSGLLVPETAAAQNGSRAGPPGSTVPLWST